MGWCIHRNRILVVLSEVVGEVYHVKEFWEMEFAELKMKVLLKCARNGPPAPFGLPPTLSLRRTGRQVNPPEDEIPLSDLAKWRDSRLPYRSDEGGQAKNGTRRMHLPERYESLFCWMCGNRHTSENPERKLARFVAGSLGGMLHCSLRLVEIERNLQIHPKFR